MAGRVEAVGGNVRNSSQVMKYTGMYVCGLGGFAEYVCAPEDAIGAETGQYVLRRSSGVVKWRQ